MKGRNDLALYFKELGFNTGAEIGVSQGLYSRTLLEANPNLKLYMIDPWRFCEGDLVRDGDNIIPSTQEIIDIFYNNARHNVSGFKNVNIIRKTSMEAVSDFKQGSLDFAYIDAKHTFDFVMLDIIAWSAKVRKGGIVSGHDYTDDNAFDVKIAVDAYAKAHNKCVMLLTKDENPSWMWIN